MTTYNCITDTTVLSVLRIGASTFVAGAGETLTLDCGKLVVGVDKKYNKIAVGVCAEMTAEEKTTVDTANATAAIGIKIYKSRRALQSISSDVNIDWRPYVSDITAYVSPISLEDGTQAGQEKKVYNNGTGGFILINGTYDGDTQMRINANMFACLLWNGSVWRHIDGIVGVSFSTP